MSARKLRPTGTKVLVRPIPVATHSDSGLLELPVAYMQPSGQGIVLAAGPGHYDRKGNFIPNDLKPGDKIFYNWIDGREIEDGDRKLVILNQQNILGIAL